MTPSEVKEARQLLNTQETLRDYRAHLSRFPEVVPGIPRTLDLRIGEDSDVWVPPEMGWRWLDELDQYISERLRALGVDPA